MSTRVLDAALDYLARGWTVMPVGTDKRPLLASWKALQTERPSVEQITSWWSVWPEAGIAILTGTPSGLCVLDIDGSDGMAAVLAAGGSATVQTPTVRTGRGAHVYYQYDPALGNRNGLLPHVDLKSTGGYVLGPPSRHANGRTYTWMIPPTVTLAPLPEWLLTVKHPTGTSLGSKTYQGAQSPSTPNPTALGALKTWLASAKPGTSGAVRCPAHHDRSPSLQVWKLMDGSARYRCWGPGCSADVIGAMVSAPPDAEAWSLASA